jgi:hypothetical protein
VPDRDLPEDKNKPCVINGIKFTNRAEYNDRIMHDATVLAELLYDIYQSKQLKKSSVASEID